ncbi:hypothetical protein Tco_1496364, partial [Tanacetum coccineum]
EIREHSGKNKRKTRRAFEHYVILTSSSGHEGADTVVSPNTTSPKVGSHNPHVQMRVEDVDACVVNKTVNTSLLENDANAASIPGKGLGPPLFPGLRPGLLPRPLMTGL